MENPKELEIDFFSHKQNLYIDKTLREHFVTVLGFEPGSIRSRRRLAMNLATMHFKVKIWIPVYSRVYSKLKRSVQL